VVLTPETTVEQAMVLAERLRLAIAEIEVPYEEQTLAMTVSLGVAGFDRDDDDIAHTLQLADKRLYEAKRTGRNRVVGELRVLA
jgi:diguanylate cyclase (GGDEF)-like protein